MAPHAPPRARSASLLVLSLLLLPALAHQAPVAQAGTACRLVLVEAAAECGFLCAQDDSFVITANYLAPGLDDIVRIGVRCGGDVAPETDCAMLAIGPWACATGGRASADSVGTCYAIRDPGEDLVSNGVLTADCYAASRYAVAIAPTCERGEDGVPRTGGELGEVFVRESGTEACTAAYWAEDHRNASIVHEVYEFQFPGCAPPSCRLAVTVYAPLQVDPDDPSAPFYKVSSPVCTREDLCSIAEYATANLIGWNGTAIIQCSPGTQAVTFFVPPECSRGGFNLGPKSTALLMPRVTQVRVPFGKCVPHVFHQTVEATLIQGPLGETYRIPAIHKTSVDKQVCNTHQR